MIVMATLAALAFQDGPQDTSANLKELEWIIGTWEGEGKLMNNPFTATATYEWTMNKCFIKSTYVAKMGDQVMWQDSGMWGWDRDKKKLVFFSFGMDGTIGTGDRMESKEKDTWIFETKLNAVDPEWREGRAVMKKVDADTYTERGESKKKDGTYAVILESTMKRKKK
jgi:hypothetical protein